MGERGESKLLSLSLTVAYESSILTAVHMIVDGQQVLVVELECLRELVHELPGCVDELSEYGRDLLAVSCQETTPVCELMSKHEPVFLYEGLIALDRPIEWVKEQLGHGTSLTGPVPTIAAVDNHTGTQNDGISNVHRRLQHGLQMPQPLRLFDALKKSLHGVGFLFARFDQFGE